MRLEEPVRRLLMPTQRMTHHSLLVLTGEADERVGRREIIVARRGLYRPWFHAILRRDPIEMTGDEDALSLGQTFGKAAPYGTTHLERPLEGLRQRRFTLRSGVAHWGQRSPSVNVRN